MRPGLRKIHRGADVEMAVETQNQTTAAVEPGAGGGAGEGRSTAVTGGAPASLEEMPSMRDMLAEELAGPEVTPDQKDRKPGKGREDRGQRSEVRGQGTEDGRPKTEVGTKAKKSATSSDVSEDAEAIADEGADGNADEGTEAETAGETPDEAAEGEPEVADPDGNETEDGTRVPKGMEDWPKQAVKRIQNQSAKISALEAQIADGGVTITPTPANPYSDVESVALEEKVTPAEVLDRRYAAAKARRTWCLANPDGGTVQMRNGREIEVSAEKAQQTLAEAEAEIDAYPDAKLRVAQRANEKPWVTATTLEPGLLQKGTPENGFLLHVLKAVPEIKAKLPDWEVFMAAATRGMRIITEEQAGRARYVRMALGKDGKVIPGKAGQPAGAGSALGGAKTATAGKPQATPHRPGATKPGLQVAGAKASVNMQDLEAKAMAGDDAAAKALLRAELEAA